MRSTHTSDAFDISKYMPMLYSKVRQTWWKLPPSVRGWVELEDMVEEAILLVYRDVLPRFDPTRAQLSTFMWWTLDNHHKTVLQHYYASKRMIVDVYPVVSCTEIRPFHEVVEAAAAIFLSASKNLQNYMIRWFLDAARIKTQQSRSYRSAIREMARLCREYHFSSSDFNQIRLRDDYKAALSRALAPFGFISSSNEWQSIPIRIQSTV